ncbi:hypothetical protein ACJX0J_029299 [Zea mays]
MNISVFGEHYLIFENAAAVVMVHEITYRRLVAVQIMGSLDQWNAQINKNFNCKIAEKAWKLKHVPTRASQTNECFFIVIRNIMAGPKLWLFAHKIMADIP